MRVVRGAGEALLLVSVLGGCGLAAPPQSGSSKQQDPTVTVMNTVTATETLTTTVTVTRTPSEMESSAPQSTKTARPQGTVALDEWHDLSGDLTCAVVQTYYDNRSDTAILKLQQDFVMSYTPKHAEGEYPDSVDGPRKSLTQTVGIAPYTRKEIRWRVCAPELRDKQNEPRADGIDSFMSEVGARPETFTWTWAG